MGDEPLTPDEEWIQNMLLGAILLALVLWAIYSAVEERQKQAMLQARLAEQEKEKKKMTIPYREVWSLADIAPYDGLDDSKPILFAADGKVYNVWRGRHFYGHGAPYHCFAGKEATRMLAKELLEHEEEDEAAKPLTAFHKMQLQEWIGTFEWKYDVVGNLEQWEEHYKPLAYDGLHALDQQAAAAAEAEKKKKWEDAWSDSLLAGINCG